MFHSMLDYFMLIIEELSALPFAYVPGGCRVGGKRVGLPWGKFGGKPVGRFPIGGAFAPLGGLLMPSPGVPCWLCKD